jgi:hypothetical protein
LQIKHCFSLPSLHIAPLQFFICNADGGREDNKDYGKIYIKRARHSLSLREMPLSADRKNHKVV